MDENGKNTNVKLMEDACYMDDSSAELEENLQVDENAFAKIQHPKKRAFLAAYARTGNITQSAAICKIDRSNHTLWMRKDLVYVEAFQQAGLAAADYLEAEARRRAVTGTLKPVFYQGMECGTIREYSDTLLIFLLKGALPEKYSERFQGNINIEANINVNLSEQERHQRLSALLQDAIDVSYEDVSDQPLLPDTVSSNADNSADDSQKP